MQVSVVIPALNEERVIGSVVRNVLATGLVHRVVVVDNGSVDGTAQAARVAGAKVVVEPRRGYDTACLAGLAQLQIADGTLPNENPTLNSEPLTLNSSVIVFMDGDGSDDVEDLNALLEPIRRGEADMVIGSRTRLADRGSLTPQQRWGNALATTLMRWIWGIQATDLGPFRAITRPALDALHMVDRRYAWTIEMQIRAAEEGLRVAEIPVRYHPRVGLSKISGTLAGVWRAGKGILGSIVRHLPWPGPLLLIGGLMEAAYLSFGELRMESLALPAYLGLMAWLFMGFGAAMAWIKRQVDGKKLSPPFWMAMILLGGIIFRLTLFPVGPLTSDDVYRYVWDGKVQAHGINPYAYPPAHEALSRLKDSRIHSAMNHPELVTIYPPVAQWGFRISYELGGDSLIGFKTVSLLAEAVTVWLLMVLLRWFGRSPLWVLGYAWCPLPIVEFFANGHVDALGIPFMLGAVWLALEGRWVWSAVGLAFGGLVKLVPLLFAPLFMSVITRGRRLIFLLVLEAVMIWICHWYQPEIQNGLATLFVYAGAWRFNGPVFNLVEWGVGRFMSGGRFLNAIGWSREVCLVGMVLVVVWISRHVKDWPRAMAWTLTAFALMVPTVFPWYLTWLVPLLVLSPLMGGWALIALTQLSYITLIEYYRRGVWYEPHAILMWQYLPVAVLLAWDALKAKRKVWEA